MRFAEEHLPKKRPSTQRDYQSSIARHILPELKHLKVTDVSYSDVDALHRKITKRGTPYHANRVLALLSKMFSQAIRWGWRADNPTKGIERNQEHKRQRYLSADELGRLTLALAEHDDQQAANIIRLLLLTGARRG
jgi:integrase